ncbi:hypothetical protein [Budvicia aquatica]|nr:hypothetical protein [Budvicia aquatica]
MSPADSDSKIIRSIAPYLADRNITKITFDVDDEIFYVRVVPVGEELGLQNWRMAVIVPQNDLVGIFNKDRIITIFSVVLIFIIGVTLGMDHVS